MLVNFVECVNKFRFEPLYSLLNSQLAKLHIYFADERLLKPVMKLVEMQSSFANVHVDPKLCTAIVNFAQVS